MNTVNYKILSDNELANTSGGIILTIGAVTIAGWKAVAVLGGGLTLAGGAVGLGVYNGYNSTRKR